MPNTGGGGEVRRFELGNFERPKTIPEVQAIVVRVKAAKGRLRVRGSEHSVAAAVYTDGFDPVTGPAPGAGCTNLILDDLLEPSGPTVTATVVSFLAGHHLGFDPYGTATSQDPANSIVHHLSLLGRALPELGGISHQSIGGFLSTGSAGGSVDHDVTDCICWVRLVDGSGALRHLVRSDPEFPAVIASLGLLGIIVEVGFSLVDGEGFKALPPAYDVAMTSDVVKLEEDGTVRLPFRTFNPFTQGEFAAFFRQTEYARVMWWPQPGVCTFEVWTGKRAAIGGPSRPYVDLTPQQQRMAGWVYRNLLGSGPAATPLQALAEGLAVVAGPLLWLRDLLEEPATMARSFPPNSPREWLVATLINLFVRPQSEQDLRDVWYEALPHDNQMDDDLMPVIFTELWVDLDQADVAMKALRDLIERDRLEATGTMCFEIYATKARDAWLGASYQQDVLRIDPFVFRVDAQTQASSMAFFRRHWTALKELGFRCHWGKVLEKPTEPTGAAYRERQFPMLRDFRTLRTTYDPDDLFLTPYWEGHLGIP